MPYTVSQVRGSNPDVLNTAATDAETSARRVDAQVTQGREQMAALADDWTGSASDAAQKEYRERIDDQIAYAAALREVKTTLAEHGPALVDLRSQLDTAVNNAEDWWDVADDGSVTPGFWLTRYANLSDVTALTVEAQRLEVQMGIKLLLARFEAQDLAAGNAIRKIGWALT